MYLWEISFFYTNLHFCLNNHRPIQIARQKTFISIKKACALFSRKRGRKKTYFAGMCFVLYLPLKHLIIMRRENNSINNSVLEMKSLLAKKYHMSCMKAREKKLKRKQRECVCEREKERPANVYLQTENSMRLAGLWPFSVCGFWCMFNVVFPCCFAWPKRYLTNTFNLFVAVLVYLRSIFGGQYQNWHVKDVKQKTI